MENKKARVLVNEDDYENKKFLEVFLSQYFDVDICDSAETFYECLNKEKYDAILMDISIHGDKDGLMLTQEIKNNPQYKDIPVICYTAHALHKDRINALNAGCEIYLAKPVNNTVLLNTLKKAVEKKKDN